jgi:hypothetical protein
MKKLVLILLISYLPKLVVSGQTIGIANNSKINRKDALVPLNWSELMAKNPNLDPTNFKIVEAITKAEVPYQLEYLGEKEIMNLIVQVNVPSNKTLRLNIVKGKPKPLTTKTFARFVPERLDDFAWENEKIGFRTYGKALEGTKGDAYGLDVWVKRKAELVIDRRYKLEKYHVDNGDGLDYYHVGHTLGAGNIAPIVNNEIIYSKNYHRYKILDNGPLRTTFILEYDAWQVDGIPVTSTKKISIDAGSQMNKIEVNYNFPKKDTLAVVVGIIKRPEQGNIVLNEKEGITSYWEPMHGEDGTTGVGVVLTNPVTATSITKEQILTHSNIIKGKPFVYYMGAAWNKAGEITEAAVWEAYLNNFKNTINTPLTVKIQ